MSSLIIPEWPAPANVRACSTTRIGGVSQQPYDSLNLGAHVADDPVHVLKNRHLLCDIAGLPAMPLWLNQVHGTHVVTLPHTGDCVPQADACYTRAEGQVCAVMTADCLPVIFCSKDGREVAAAHAGWRGYVPVFLKARWQRSGARRKISWYGWDRPSARRRLRLARKCARRLLPTTPQPQKPLSPTSISISRISGY